MLANIASHLKDLHRISLYLLLISLSRFGILPIDVLVAMERLANKGCVALNSRGGVVIRAGLAVQFFVGELLIFVTDEAF